MNRINQLFETKSSRILSVYFTAGHPTLNSTPQILQALQSAGVDMVEVGMPFSDPLADGPVIQKSSEAAIKNGFTLALLFEQLANIRATISMPLLLMGYLNPVLQFGFERFCQKAAEVGIDGIILPDLPLDEYQQQYHTIAERYNLRFIFLITPQTSNERIKQIDALSTGFIYVVSSASTTGAKSQVSATQHDYFKRIASLKLRNPMVVGFGISSAQTFDAACQYANGAIIGSAFVNMLSGSVNLPTDIAAFVKAVKG